MSKVECECGDKIGFHDLERQLAEAQGLLREIVNAKPARLKAVMFAAENYIRIALGESE